MVTNTYEGSRVSELSHGPARTPITVSSQPGNGRQPFRGDCEEHGIHDAAELPDVEEIVIERDEGTYRLGDNYSVSTCEECLAEFRRETRLLEADSAEAARGEGPGRQEVLTRLIELNWRHLRLAFTPDDRSNRETIPVGSDADADAGAGEGV